MEKQLLLLMTATYLANVGGADLAKVTYSYKQIYDMTTKNRCYTCMTLDFVVDSTKYAYMAGNYSVQQPEVQKYFPYISRCTAWCQNTHQDGIYLHLIVCQVIEDCDEPNDDWCSYPKDGVHKCLTVRHEGGGTLKLCSGLVTCETVPFLLSEYLEEDYIKSDYNCIQCLGHLCNN